MRYLRISGVVQRKGRGLIIVPAKHLLAEQLAKDTATRRPIMDVYRELCNGAALPTDNLDTAKALLSNMESQLKANHILYDLSDRPLNTVAEINIARQYLEKLWMDTDELKYASEQSNQWQEISDYMSLLIDGGGKKIDNDDEDNGIEDNGIEVPKEETPIYLEWTLWRAALAMGALTNHPSEVRGFRLDSDFLPVSTAGGGQGDLYWEYQDFTILTEVTMSRSSRQEAMEGEPARRHVSDAVLKYGEKNIPVYGLFVAIKIDTNTAETFRHGIWYTKDDAKQRLDILPLPLEQFQSFFVSLFQSNEPAKPQKVKQPIENCVHIALETHYLMMCTAFEKIGYFIHNNGSDHKREQSFENYIKTIIDDTNSDAAIPLSYPETWKKETNELYKDIKHAGRGHTQPEGEQLLKHLNEGILLMRVWIAKHLGCDMAKLTDSLRYDRQVNMYGIKLH